MSRKSKLDENWEKIFSKHRILEKVNAKGFINISAKEINEFREARLMTKFDHRSQLPTLFVKNNLSILPTSRGTYTIGEFETFNDFNTDETDIQTIEFPSFLESLDYKNITSESTAINCAFVSNILHNFTEEDNLLPTVNGRMSSSAFDFKVNSSKGLFKVVVENSQIEIDGGYEGDNSLVLIEAKNYISDDFLVRQLYYPFRLWNEKVTKKVRPVFLTYSNGVFHLREYEFSEPNKYNSLVLVRHRKYVVQEGSFNIEALEEIIDKTKLRPEPTDVPFPQADSFERVINLCELLNERQFITKEDITLNYDFDQRQTDYYSNAGRYLGLIEIGKDNATGQIGCFLSKLGKQIFEINIIDRQREFAKLVLSQKAFKNSLKLYLSKGEMPSKDEIVEIMRKSKLNRVDSDSTYFRRASTISGWINWILEQVEE